MIKLSEKLFLALIIVTLLLPAPLTLWIHGEKLGPHLLPTRLTRLIDRVKLEPQFDWIANRTLYGVTIKSDLPSVNLASWMSGDLQKGLNTLVSDNFAGRELLVRIYNQTLYSAFHKSYMNFEMIIPGKDGDLFERNYLLFHGGFREPIPNGENEALVVMMKYLSERLKELGSCFVFVITPNKANVYPEGIPDRYLEKIKNGKQGSTDYENLVPLLKRYSVPYVDGREITLAHKETLSVRAFSKTGTHWSRAVAFFTTAALLKTIERESGREMPQLSESIESVDQRPDYTDDDLLNLLNIIQKPKQRYLHPVFQIPDSWPRRKGILTFIGGSYVGQMLNALESAQVFDRINYYFYFIMSRQRFPGDIFSSVDENAIPWQEDFWNTRAVVLEANEYAIDGRHIRSFLMAALAALQQNRPQERGVDDPPRPLSWGFGAGENGNSLAKKGFSISGTSTDLDFRSRC